MWHFDDDELDSLAAEGPHSGAIISEAELTHSSGGDAMVKLTITDPRGKLLAWDNIMLEGRGLNIGIKKLSVLRIATRSADGNGWDIPDVEKWTLSPPFIVTLKHEDFNGKTSAKVDFDAPGFGYEAVFTDAPPTIKEAPDQPSVEDEDDIPF